MRNSQRNQRWLFQKREDLGDGDEQKGCLQISEESAWEDRLDLFFVATKGLIKNNNCVKSLGHESSAPHEAKFSELKMVQSMAAPMRCWIFHDLEIKKENS